MKQLEQIEVTIPLEYNEVSLVEREDISSRRALFRRYEGKVMILRSRSNDNLLLLAILQSAPLEGDVFHVQKMGSDGVLYNRTLRYDDITSLFRGIGDGINMNFRYFRQTAV